MTQNALKLAGFLIVFAPTYFVFVRSLRHLSQQKSKPLSRLSGGASQG